MKHIAFISILLSFLFLGCGEDDKKEKCYFEDPLTDLPWLKEIVHERVQGETGMYINIFQCTYKNSALTGFYIEPCVNCNDYNAYLASCDGFVLDDFSGTLDMKKFHEKWNIKNKKIIWTNIK